jgi:hypothetical protein
MMKVIALVADGIALAVLSAVAAGQTAQSVSTMNCASAVEKPDYPALARQARILGLITAHFMIDATGKADGIRLEGNPILAKEADNSIRRTGFPLGCQYQTLDVTFQFRLVDEPLHERGTSVVFKAPNEYIVTSNEDNTITCLYETNVSDPPAHRRYCGSAIGLGRRIVSESGLVEFRVPLFAAMTKTYDVDYVIYGIRFGEKEQRLSLIMMFGIFAAKRVPHALENKSITWTSTQWSCGEKAISDSDWRGIADDLRWRHISIPFGYAAYQGVPKKAADYFDRILDTMCCGRCPLCK